MEDVDQLIPQRKGFAMLGISPMTGWRRQRDDPSFPKRVLIGPDRYGFRLSDLLHYIGSRPVAETPSQRSGMLEAQAVARARRARIKALEAELARERRAEGEAA